VIYTSMYATFIYLNSDHIEAEASDCDSLKFEATMLIL